MSRFQPYHIFQRKNSKDRIIFYVRFLCLDTGKTFRTMSSGLSNRVAAARWAEAKLPEIQAEQELQHRGHIPTLERYAESYFDDDGPYASNRRERGYVVAQVYLYTARCYTRNHIIPTWGHYRLDLLELSIRTSLHSSKPVS